MAKTEKSASELRNQRDRELCVGIMKLATMAKDNWGVHTYSSIEDRLKNRSLDNGKHKG